MTGSIAQTFVENVLEVNQKYFGICVECGHAIVKEHKGYYCEHCNEEYVKCPVCEELVPEDEMTYYFEDKVCRYCKEENGYGA